MIAFVTSLFGSIAGKYLLIAALSGTVLGLFRLWVWNRDRGIYNKGYDAAVEKVQEVERKTVEERLEKFEEQKGNDSAKIKEIKDSRGDGKTKKRLGGFLDE